CLFPLQTGKQKSAHPSSKGGVAGSPSARPEGSAERKPRMEPWWGLFYLTLLCSLMHIRGQGDFDLADALGDPDSLSLADRYSAPDAPSMSADLREPKPPGKLWTTAFTHPRQQQALCKLLSQPTKEPSSDIYPKPTPPHQPQPGNPDNSGNIYPRPKPLPRPQPGSSDNDAGGDGHPSYGNPQGNRIAKIVSPILCGVLVTLVGATTSYFRHNRKRNCCRTNGKTRKHLRPSKPTLCFEKSSTQTRTTFITPVQSSFPSRLKRLP
ncbi:hypothetical protein EI555_002229, partial [Monodon monoceros]